MGKPEPINGTKPVFDQNEALLIAVLHKSGLGRGNHDLFTEELLAKVMCRGARAFEEIFEPFKPHPRYHDFPLIGDMVSTMVLGGGLVWIGPDFYIEISPHTAGAYGELQFRRFLPKFQAQIVKVAGWLREAVHARTAPEAVSPESKPVAAS